MARPGFDALNNVTAMTLRWTNTGVRSVLGTGIVSFAAHLAPITSRQAPRARSFGEAVSEALICDYETDIAVGDIVVVLTLRGETADTIWRVVRGVEKFPATFIPHAQVYVERYKQ